MSHVLKLRKSLVVAMAVATMALPLVALSGGEDKGNGNGNGNGSSCAGLPSPERLRTALVAARGASNGGFNLDMWGTIVNRDGVVCAVAFTGTNRGDQWPGSRVISAQKANTANAFSLPGLSLSTANLWAAVQPAVRCLQENNPVDVSAAYGGNSANQGQRRQRSSGRREDRRHQCFRWRLASMTKIIRSLAESASAAMLPARITTSPGELGTTCHWTTCPSASAEFPDVRTTSIIRVWSESAEPGERFLSPDLQDGGWMPFRVSAPRFL